MGEIKDEYTISYWIAAIALAFFIGVAVGIVSVLEPITH